MTTENSPAWQLIGLMDGFLTTQLVYVAAKLGVAEILLDAPRTGAELADAVGADARALTRVLRGLAASGLLTESDDGRFALTELGRTLQPLRGMAIVRGDLYYRAAAGLLDTVRDGTVAFDRVYGEPFFDHLAGHAEVEAAFQASMIGRASQEARDVVAAYDFGSLQTLVDVGGGSGVLLAAILESAPGLRGILMEREAVLASARDRFRQAGLAARAECVAGDFFEHVPAGADAYVLSRVLHDWSDADARDILRTCRRAVPEDGRLLVVDAILPDRAADGPFAVGMDLHMLLLFGGRERTEAEFETLLGEAGFGVRRTSMTASPARLAVIEATTI